MDKTMALIDSDKRKPEEPQLVRLAIPFDHPPGYVPEVIVSVGVNKDGVTFVNFAKEYPGHVLAAAKALLQIAAQLGFQVLKATHPEPKLVVPAGPGDLPPNGRH